MFKYFSNLFFKLNEAIAKEFISLTSHLDRIFPSLMTPLIKKDIIRIFIAHYDSSILRIYPGHNIHELYDMSKGTIFHVEVSLI